MIGEEEVMSLVELLIKLFHVYVIAEQETRLLDLLSIECIIGHSTVHAFKYNVVVNEHRLSIFTIENNIKYGKKYYIYQKKK